MNMWAIIPVKPFAQGKSRLADVLDAGGRTALNRRMFRHVFEVALSVLGPKRTVVITTDPALRVLIKAQGARAIEERANGLNGALAQATHHAVTNGVDAVLILPADLPLLTADDVRAMMFVQGRGCAIAPDMEEEGTNALLIAPPAPDFFRFGPHSFPAHLEAAQSRGLATQILRRPGLACDLDTPEDYRLLMKRQGVPA